MPYNSCRLILKRIHGFLFADLKPGFYLFTFFLSINLQAQIIEVCNTCEFKEIQSAIDHAVSGDTVLIKKGHYKVQNLTIDKPLHILGEDLPVIDGQFKEYVFQIKTDNFSLEGLKIMNPGQSYTKDFAAVLVSKSKNFTIKNNILEKVFFGFLIEKSHYGEIYNNKVSSDGYEEAGSGNGIHLWHCSNMKIQNNELYGLRDGIYFEFVSNSEILENYSHQNIRYGLHFMFSNHNNYHHNKFYKNGAGVAVMFSKFIEMRHNEFLENWGSASYGLLLKEIYDADIEYNLFEQNTIAINIDGSTRINYKNNTLTRNGWAVKVVGACYENIFQENNFMNNAFDLSYNSNINTNRFERNYWSDYTGYDLDKDGIGDVPYRPVKLFSYIVNLTPETIVLLRSLFVDIINFSEKVSPVFTPDNLSDNQPLMSMKK